jgi:hypothetical protein
VGTPILLLLLFIAFLIIIGPLLALDRRSKKKGKARDDGSQQRPAPSSPVHWIDGIVGFRGQGLCELSSSSGKSLRTTHTIEAGVFRGMHVN